VTVEKSNDVVILTDGTKIVGTIIAVGQRRLIMIEEGAKKDRAIDRSDVESFRRGASLRKSVGYRVEKDAYKGVLTLAEEDPADPTATTTVVKPSKPIIRPAPTPKPGPKVPGPKPKPGPGPKPAPKVKLDRLWPLLEGNKTTPRQISNAFARHPDWGAEVTRLIRSRKIPDEGKKAFVSFKKRVRTDKAFRDGLAEQVRKGKLPPGVLEVLKAR
jgi:hypothetical protein